VPVTAGEVITAARDVHPAFDWRRNPDPVLLRFLNRYHRALCGKAVHRNESILAQEQVVPLPLAVFADGIALPAYQYLHGATLVLVMDPTDKRPLEIVPWAHRYDPGKFPAAWIHGDHLYLRGEATDWVAWGSIVLSYTPIAPDITAVTDTFLLPDTALACLVAATAAYLGTRGAADPGLPKIPLEALKIEAAQAEEDFLNDVFLRRGAQTIRTREVW
jgi:hypothetical protein